MFGIHDFGVFIASCIVLNITPGPDTLYILGRSMAQGRAAGIASVLGIAAGTVVHTLAAALGVSALLAASASAFMVIKFAGAAYLVYLGVRMIATRASGTAIPTSFSSAGFAPILRQGFLTNLLNPKVALFFLAFVPQFIAADSSTKFAAFVTLGFSFIGTGTVWCLFLVWVSAWLGDRLRGNSGFADWLNPGAGALFVFLGIRLAASK
jgi:threonine/homoserine/homoserine lactone efflux protein